MEYEYVTTEIEGKVAVLKLRRPPSNLLNIAMMEELNDALMALRSKAKLQVVVLRGGDGLFCEGIDLKEHSQKRVQRLIRVFLRIFETMRMMEQISIAAVEGAAVGGGFELALGCNLIVAADDTRFALPQVRQGIIPPVATAVLPRIAPRRRAMEWVLLGDPIDPARLEQDGVVNRLFPADRFESMLDAFVVALAQRSGPVLKLARQAQFEAYYTPFPEALVSIHGLYMKQLMSLHDAREGPRAVRESRDPVWKNS